MPVTDGGKDNTTADDEHLSDSGPGTISNKKEPTNPAAGQSATNKDNSNYPRYDYSNAVTARATVGILIATSIYAVFAILQWCALRTGNQQTRTALHITERAYVMIGPPVLDKEHVQLTAEIENIGKIPSGQGTITSHQITVRLNGAYAEPTQWAAIIGTHIRRDFFESVIPSVRPPNHLNVNIVNFQAGTIEAGTQAYYLVGIIQYKDGFPDDPIQQWPFCWRTSYLLRLKQIVSEPCDSATMLPLLPDIERATQNKNRNKK